MHAASVLAFAVALRMRAAGRGGSEDEVEEVDEVEDEEEVVDAGWAVMRPGLRAAASAAATAGGMEGMSSGCRLGAGGWGGQVVTSRPGGLIWSAAAGEGGAGLWPSPSGLGWARVLQCVRWCGLFCRCPTHQNSFRTMFGMIFKPQNKSLRHFLGFWNKLTLLPLKTYVVGVRGGELFAWAAFRGRGGWAWVFWGVCGGRGRATGWGGRAAGCGAPLGGDVWVVECGGW